MASKKWRRGLKLEIDGDAVRDFSWSFTAWLEGETIASVDATAVDCDVANVQHTNTGVTYRLSNVSGNSASVQLRVVTSSGQRDDFTIGYREIQK